MSRVITTVITDDLDGAVIDAADYAPTRFSIDGKEMEIDLSAENRQQLLDALDPYISAGRTTRSRRRGTARGKASAPAAGGGRSGAIREWAAANGYEVAPRGRIAAAVVDAYDAAH